MIKLNMTVIAIQDMERSLAFYETFFGKGIELDLGWCKTLSCGVTLQAHFVEVAGFPEELLRYRSHSMGLYFETEDFDSFIALLKKHPEVEKLHELKVCPWLQRNVHIYDPDGHLIEVAETMYSVGCRLFSEGKGIEETAKLTFFPVDTVRQWKQQYLQNA